MNKRRTRNPNIKAGVTVRVHREADYPRHWTVLEPPPSSYGKLGTVLQIDDTYERDGWDALVCIEGMGDYWIDHAFLEVV